MHTEYLYVLVTKLTVALLLITKLTGTTQRYELIPSALLSVAPVTVSVLVSISPVRVAVIKK